MDCQSFQVKKISYQSEKSDMESFMRKHSIRTSGSKKHGSTKHGSAGKNSYPQKIHTNNDSSTTYNSILFIGPGGKAQSGSKGGVNTSVSPASMRRVSPTTDMMFKDDYATTTTRHLVEVKKVTVFCGTWNINEKPIDSSVDLRRV